MRLEGLLTRGPPKPHHFSIAKYPGSQRSIPEKGRFSKPTVNLRSSPTGRKELVLAGWMPLLSSQSLTAMLSAAYKNEPLKLQTFLPTQQQNKQQSASTRRGGLDHSASFASLSVPERSMTPPCILFSPLSCMVGIKSVVSNPKSEE